MRGRPAAHVPFIATQFATDGSGFGVVIGSVENDAEGWREMELPAVPQPTHGWRSATVEATVHFDLLAKPARTQDLHAAQLKLLREHYPRLFVALAKKDQWLRDGVSRADMMEAWLRAYCADVMHTFKRCRLFAQIPTNVELIVMLGAAAARATPFDAVDAELANGWEAFGYSTMKPADYCAKINAKLGTRLKPGAMKARALDKLRLTSQRPEGRTANDG
jgi:hypothetical protein